MSRTIRSTGVYNTDLLQLACAIRNNQDPARRQPEKRIKLISQLNNVVYVVGIMDLSRIGPTEKEIVKIGKADNLENRLAEFRTAHHNPLAVLTTYPGAEDLEKALHTWFESRRYHQPDDRRYEKEWFDFRDTDPLPLIDHAVRIIRHRKLEWESEEHRKTAIQQATRSTRLAQNYLHHLGTEFSRILVMGEQVHAEASHILASGSTQVDRRIYDLVFKEHSYLLHLLAERLDWRTADLLSMMRKAVSAKVLTPEEAEAATTLDCDTIAQIRNKKFQALAALWRKPLINLGDLLGWRPDNVD